MTPPSFSVVLTDFNGWTQTQRCLRNLAQAGVPQQSVILVDHGTDQHTRTGVTTHFPSVQLIGAAPDLWWAGATNVGLRAALGRETTHVMLLNNDCYLTALAVDTLQTHAARQPRATIAPVQRDSETHAILCAVPDHNILLGFTTVMRARSLTPDMRRSPLQRTRLILGGRGVLIPRSVFEAHGLLDEQAFPHYGADHDFFLRIAAAGEHLLIATDADVLVDRTRTSIADDPCSLTFRQFLHSLTAARSHRNLRVQYLLIKRYYPVKQLHLIGFALFVARYLAKYASCRVSRLLPSSLID
jgi:GT2 family glycosyltransferase